PELVTIEDLQHALNDKLARKQPGQPLQAKAEAVIPGKEGLLLRLRLSGSHCGLVHLSVRPHWDESGLVLKPSLLSESGLDEVVRQALVEKLRGPLPVALPSGDIIEGLPLLVDTSLAIAGRMSELEALALDADVVL